MDANTAVARLEHLVAHDDTGGLGPVLQALVASVGDAHGQRQGAAFAALIAHVEHPNPIVGAHVALAAGALVESGLPAAPLARALVAPIARSVATARRFAELSAEAPDAPGDDGVELGDRLVDRRAIETVARAEPLGAQAFRSLDTWYRPAVLAWSVETDVLQQLQTDTPWRTGLAALNGANTGSYWLSLLMGVALQRPLVVLVPELREAYTMTLNGVLDMGQLFVLLSHALASPLKRLNASGPASPAILAVMSGEGPQQRPEVSYSAAFTFYSWEAVNPATGLPEHGRFTWIAPGGCGDIWLPADFQPSALRLLHGCHVLVLISLNAAPGLGVTRQIPAVRTFAPLRASVDEVVALEPQASAEWFEAVRRTVSS